MKVQPSLGQATRSPFWLVVRSGPGRLKPLTLDVEGERVLAVFSFKEEAEIFLRLGGIGDVWLTKESSRGELVSVLFEPRADVRSVALDPLPEIAALEMALVSVGRERFVERLTGQERLLALRFRSRSKSA